MRRSRTVEHDLVDVSGLGKTPNPLSVFDIARQFVSDNKLPPPPSRRSIRMRNRMLRSICPGPKPNGLTPNSTATEDRSKANEVG